MNIKIIRHGKTIANEKKLYCGFTDLDLSSDGIKELKKLKGNIDLSKKDLIITSDLKRTIHTMKILFDNHLNHKIISNIKEFNFGDFEMKSYEELKNNKDYINWITGDENVKCPNGENTKLFKERIFYSFDIIKDLNADDLLIICHGGVITTLMDELFPKQKNFYDWQPSFGRGYQFDFNKNTASNLISI